MKSFKNLDLKNNKVLLGLFSLLFILVTAQTAAILDTNSDLQNQNQSAQVASASSTCLTVTPSSSVLEANFPFTEGGWYSYRMNFRVRNTCPYAIKIVDPRQYNPVLNLRNTGVQVVNAINSSPIDINIANNTYGIQGVSEEINCTGCEDGATTYHSYNGVNSGIVRVIGLNAGQSRNIMAYVVLETPNTPSAYIRTKLNSLNWFRADTTLADGVVYASEVNTATFTNAFSNGSATSYLRAYRPLPGDGLTEEEIKNMLTNPEIKSPLEAKTQ